MAKKRSLMPVPGTKTKTVRGKESGRPVMPAKGGSKKAGSWTKHIKTPPGGKTKGGSQLTAAPVIKGTKTSSKGVKSAKSAAAMSKAGMAARQSKKSIARARKKPHKGGY